MNLRKTSNILSAAIFAACTMLVSLSATAQIQLLDKVIAIVDDDVVLQSELDLRVASVYAQIQQSGTQPHRRKYCCSRYWNDLSPSACS